MLSYPDPPLADDVVALRPWCVTDLACIEAASTDPRIPSGTTVPRVCSQGAALAFIDRQTRRRITGDGLSQAIVDRASDTAVGLLYLGLRSGPGVASIGYWVIPAARGRGIGSRAVRLATDWALTAGGLHRVEALVHHANEPSHRTLLTTGYQREGTLRDLFDDNGQRADAAIYSRVASHPT